MTTKPTTLVQKELEKTFPYELVSKTVYMYVNALGGHGNRITVLLNKIAQARCVTSHTFITWSPDAVEGVSKDFS